MHFWGFFRFSDCCGWSIRHLKHGCYLRHSTQVSRVYLSPSLFLSLFSYFLSLSLSFFFSLSFSLSHSSLSLFFFVFLSFSLSLFLSRSFLSLSLHFISPFSPLSPPFSIYLSHVCTSALTPDNIKQSCTDGYICLNYMLLNVHLKSTIYCYSRNLFASKFSTQNFCIFVQWIPIRPSLHVQNPFPVLLNKLSRCCRNLIIGLRSDSLGGDGYCTVFARRKANIQGVAEILS
jgi:hypothetical protein